MMAASISVLASAVSRKQRLAILKKGRRKRKRQALAQAKACDVGQHMPEKDEDDDDDDDDDDEEEVCAEHYAGQERQRHHEEWLERERLAQEAFRLRSEREETARMRQEDEERKIKEEWDWQQKKEEEQKDHKQQEKKNREEAVQKMLDQAESQLSNPGPWMNPEAPKKTQSSENYGTERDVQNCPFFLKTGACRFGDRCSRKHIHPTSSSTLMIRGMFVTFGMNQCHRDDYDTDASLEHSEEDLHELFLEFYHDVLPEFQSLGRVLQFKVSCNYEPHLRGNVYVQFDTEEHCMEAYQKFNGRWYAGKQLYCELCPVTRWKNAICGLFNKLKCPKGKNCNFLHVFRNPGNEFWEADRDISPDRTGGGSHRGGWPSDRRGDGSSWRRRHGSRSPPRSERSGTGRRGSERRRSRSRDTAYSHRRGESLRSESQSSRWRPASSRRERRSRSGDRLRERLRNRSPDGGRERDSHRSRERDRSPHGSQNGDTRRGRSRSGSKDGERNRLKRGRSDNRSPDKPKHEDGEEKEGSSGDGSPVHRRHKRSKKSKKKSKKKLKKKKKSRSAETISSSGESVNQDNPDIEIKEEEEEGAAAASPLNCSDDVQEVLSVELSSNPCVESQDTAEVKSVLEETTESAHPELPCKQEEKDDDGNSIEPQI